MSYISQNAVQQQKGCEDLAVDQIDGLLNPFPHHGSFGLARLARSCSDRDALVFVSLSRTETRKQKSKEGF